MEIKVWVGDLERYNAGQLVGEWFTLPMDIGEMMDKVLVKGNEEYYIGDTDSEIDVRNMGLSEMNELAEKLDSLCVWESENLAMIWDSGYFNDLEEAIDCLNDGEYMVYHKCSDMSDVAYEWYEQTGQLQELEKVINASYIDWEAIGRDMEIEGNFYQVDYETMIQIYN